MDAAQGAKLQDWINRKCTQHMCPSCGRNQWAAGQIVSAPEFSSDGGLTIGGPAVPMAQLICGYCAYVKFYAAVPIGLAK